LGFAEILVIISLYCHWDNLIIEFHDGEVKLNEGEMFVIPKNVEHKPYAESECEILLAEPKGVVNTGQEITDQTAVNDVWI
jgi:mannose-6-phosphate isomerase-like protein (cupin superfamily)